MINTKILFSLAAILFIVALAFALLPATRYGTHGDDKTCGQYSTTEYHYSLVGYLLFSKPLESTTFMAGTCPYTDYYAKTYSIELWIVASALAVLGTRRHTTKIVKL